MVSKTQPRDLPILMNDQMVRATAAGRKKQTRRMDGLKEINASPSNFKFIDAGWNSCSGVPEFWAIFQKPDGTKVGAKNKYGGPGSRLWVREASAAEHPAAIQPGRFTKPSTAGIPGPPSVDFKTIYRADCGEPLQVWMCQEYPYRTTAGPASDADAKHPQVCSNYHNQGKGIYWTPSIHMRRENSRYLLEVTKVEIRRLQDLRTSDAIEEGFDPAECGGRVEEIADPYLWFKKLWISITGEHGWTKNPWVWVIHFRRAVQ